MLTSITIPCLSSDLPAFEQLLACWSDPRLSPIRAEDKWEPIALLVVLNKADADVRHRFSNAFSKFPLLLPVFSECLVFSAGLAGDRDLYARNQTEAKGRYGNKAGPNFLFFEAMRLASRFGGHTFQSELDCFPLNAGWLTDLRRLVERRDFAWVIGSIYTGEYPVARDIQLHMNGNAVYAVGAPEFQDFLTEIWEPRLLELTNLDPNLAYDCWWAVENSRASGIIKNNSWDIVSIYGQFMCQSQFVCNLLHGETMQADLRTSFDNADRSAQPILFVHGSVTSEAVGEFLLSDAPSLESHLRDIAAQAQSKSLLDDDFDLTLAPITAWGAGPGDDAEAEIFAPVVVDELPAAFGADELEEGAYIGNWHVATRSDHIWSGGGTAGIVFSLPSGVHRIKMLVRGAYASGLDPEDISLSIHGNGQMSVETLVENEIALCVDSASPLKIVSFLVDVKRTVRIEHDDRDLGFVLFGIVLTEDP